MEPAKERIGERGKKSLNWTASAKVLRQEQLGVFKKQCDWTEVSKGKVEDEVRKDITQNLLG